MLQLISRNYPRRQSDVYRTAMGTPSENRFGALVASANNPRGSFRHCCTDIRARRARADPAHCQEQERRATKRLCSCRETVSGGSIARSPGFTRKVSRRAVLNLRRWPFPSRIRHSADFRLWDVAELMNAPRDSATTATSLRESDTSPIFEIEVAILAAFPEVRHRWQIRSRPVTVRRIGSTRRRSKQTSDRRSPCDYTCWLFCI
jgi:hypothetical protein